MILLTAAFALIRTASAATWYVKQNASGANDGSSWSDAFTELDPALAAAGLGDEIWVAGATTFAGGVPVPQEAIYRPGVAAGAAARFELKPGVRLYGNFLGVETNLSERRLQVTDSSSNAITALQGWPDGGAPGGWLTHHVLHADAAVGSDAIVDGFRIENGGTPGAGGLDAWGGGILNEGGSPVFRNCRFAGLQADQGAAVGSTGGSPLFVNCVFWQNDSQSGDGGVVAASDGSPALINCDLAENTGPSPGTAGVVFPAGGVILNSIIWNKPGPGVEIRGSPSVAASIVQGGWPGDNISAVEPGFVDGAAGNLHLLPASPAIDAGLEDSRLLATDVEGNLRALDGNGDGVVRVDVGAYEYGVPNRITGIVIGPSRKARINFAGTTNLIYTVEASTNLLQWDVVGTASFSGADFVFRDQDAPAIGRRFYRTRLP